MNILFASLASGRHIQRPVQINNNRTLPPAAVLELAVASSIILTGSVSDLTQAMMHRSAKAATAFVECIIHQRGEITVSTQQTALASAAMVKPYSKSAASLDHRNDLLSAVFFLGAQLQSSPTEKEQATASVVMIESDVKAGYVQHPARLQSALTLLSIFTPGLMLTTAEAVHLTESLPGKEAAAGVGKSRLSLSSEFRLSGLSSASLAEIAQGDRSVPALQTVWQKLNLKMPDTAKALRLLAISRHGAQLQDYFNM